MGGLRGEELTKRIGSLWGKIDVGAVLLYAEFSVGEVIGVMFFY